MLTPEGLQQNVRYVYQHHNEALPFRWPAYIPTFNQVRSDDGGTVSGRISMNNPNLQQLPARDPEMGPMIRSLFLPEGRAVGRNRFLATGTTDLGPLCLRVWQEQTHTAEGVQEFVDGYRSDASMDFHTMVAEMANIPRKQAKTINLGMMYGMGVNKLSDQMDISVDEAKTLVKQYHSRVPFVKALMNGVVNRLNDKASAGSIRLFWVENAALTSGSPIVLQCTRLFLTVRPSKPTAKPPD